MAKSLYTIRAPPPSLTPTSWQTGTRDASPLEPHVLCFLSLCFIYSTNVYKNGVDGLRRRMEMTGTEGGRARRLETRRIASRGLGMFLYIHFFFSLLHLVVKYDDDDDRAPADASVSFFSSSSTDFFCRYSISHYLHQYHHTA